MCYCSLGASARFFVRTMHENLEIAGARSFALSRSFWRRADSICGNPLPPGWKSAFLAALAPEYLSVIPGYTEAISQAVWIFVTFPVIQPDFFVYIPPLFSLSDAFVTLNATGRYSVSAIRYRRSLHNSVWPSCPLHSSLIGTIIRKIKRENPGSRSR